MKYKPRMVVLHGPRETTIDFFKHFSRFDIDYIIPKDRMPASSSIYNSENFTLIPLSSFVPFFPDPLNSLVKKTTNLSWHYLAGLEGYIKRSDIVYIQDTYYFSNYQAVRFARKYNKLVVTTIWATISHHPSSFLPPYSFNTAEVIKNSDLFILRSNRCYRFTDSLNLDRKKTTLIYQGINLKHFYPVRSTNRKEVSILFVGQYHRSKGVKELLAAFEKLKKAGMSVRLALAGDGPLNSYIASKSQSLPVTDYGNLSYHDLAKLYRTADIFCSPSIDQNILGIKFWEEYFSYTLLEAQASGLPIVATLCGGIPEEIHKENSIVPQADVDALYKALKILVQNAEKRQYLGRLNRKRAETFFEANKQAKKTEDAILSLSGI